MSRFRLDPNNRHCVYPDDVLRVDRQLLLGGPVALYGPPERLLQHVNALESYGYRCPVFDCAKWETKATMLAALADGLGFRSHVHDLDALQHCLGELDIPELGGMALVLRQFDQFSVRFPELSWQLLDVVAGEAWLYQLYGQTLLALVQSDDPELQIARVGARAVRWALFEHAKSQPARPGGSGA